MFGRFKLLHLIHSSREGIRTEIFCPHSRTTLALLVFFLSEIDQVIVCYLFCISNNIPSLKTVQLRLDHVHLGRVIFPLLHLQGSECGRTQVAVTHKCQLFLVNAASPNLKTLFR